jgi:RIO kinase 1
LKEAPLHQHPPAQGGLESGSPYEPVTTGIPDLDSFVDRGLITHIHTQLTSGKEGTVYCCRAHPSINRKFLAAKVYREHAESSYKWDPTYFQGRERVLKPKIIRAIQARTEFGRAVAANLWVSAEYENLQKMASCGVHAPKPIARGENSILMEYVGNGAGPAPHLDSLDPRDNTTQIYFDQILEDIARLLARHLVHGDLSPYNILIWKERTWIIDVPQAVDVRFNQSAFELLHRDIKRICDFFAKHAVKRDPMKITTDLWERYQRARL